ncbi:hypothetical protein OH76DRAFT_1410102 [Lentinus brumalis]|uniref:Uncharacterized protein n=1 Tax=Lentinus brumalis TaxID=2498619 RepID=A0A371CT25_9APHY|nr:hypothetical protein OH76DRAFT_1410102 [Polyporus brumalis]
MHDINILNLRFVGLEDQQCEQLSFDLNALLNIDPAATPSATAGLPVSPTSHCGDDDINMVRL